MVYQSHSPAHSPVLQDMKPHRSTRSQAAVQELTFSHDTLKLDLILVADLEPARHKSTTFRLYTHSCTHDIPN